MNELFGSHVGKTIESIEPIDDQLIIKYVGGDEALVGVYNGRPFMLLRRLSEVKPSETESLEIELLEVEERSHYQFEMAIGHPLESILDFCVDQGIEVKHILGTEMGYTNVVVFATEKEQQLINEQL